MIETPVPGRQLGIIVAAGLVAFLAAPKTATTFMLFSVAIGGSAGGYLFERTGSYDWLWYIDIMLAVGAALIHMPIQEARRPRPALRCSRADSR